MTNSQTKTPDFVSVVWPHLCSIQFGVLLAIFTFLGITATPGDYVQEFNDKLMHSSGYFVAAFSISFALPRKSYVFRALFLIIYSFLIEVGQHFNPPRTFDLMDLAANSVGTIAGLILIYGLICKLKWFDTLINRRF